MTELKGDKPATGAQSGGFNYRSETHSGEPNLDSWLHMRDTCLQLRDQGMKRVTIVATGGSSQRLVVTIDEVIESYETLIREAGAGHLLETKKG